MEHAIDWALSRPTPWRMLAVFLVAGGIAFVSALIAMTLLMAWWAPMSSVVGGAIGCGLGTGIVCAVLYAR